MAVANQSPRSVANAGWQQPPHRTTIARRYKALYGVIKAFVLFIGQYAADLSEQFNLAHLVADKSLFKARGPVWHQVDRKAGVLTVYVTSTLMPLGARVVIMAGSMAMDFTSSVHKMLSQH